MSGQHRFSVRRAGFSGIRLVAPGVALAAAVGFGAIPQSASAQAYTLQIIANISTANGGDDPYVSAATLDASGDVWGTTYYGTGSGSFGSVFEVDAGTNVATTYASFTASNSSGYYPYSGVVLDGAGDLIGTNTGGGTDGGVYEIANTGTVSSPVYANAPTPIVSNALSPGSAVTSDANGDLFYTAGGGNFGIGQVAEIVNNGTLTAPVYAGTALSVGSFNAANGYLPESSVVIDSNGNIFGQSADYGPNSDGCIYEIVNTGTASHPAYADGIQSIYGFSGFKGASPYANMTIDKQGDLFGVEAAAGSGSSSGTGIVYELKNTGTTAAPAYTGALITLGSVNYGIGMTPNQYPFAGGLTFDSGGDLFGTTANGGAEGDGTVFEIPFSSGSFGSLTTIGVFNSLVTSVDGETPSGTLAINSSGDIYGTTEYGGTSGLGTVFELTPNSISAAGSTAPEPASLLLAAPALGLSGINALRIAIRRRRKAGA